jgi:hypothetical protein
MIRIGAHRHVPRPDPGFLGSRIALLNALSKGKGLRPSTRLGCRWRRVAHNLRQTGIEEQSAFGVAYFLQQLINGPTLGSIYRLIAIG